MVSPQPHSNIHYAVVKWPLNQFLPQTDNAFNAFASLLTELGLAFILFWMFHVSFFVCLLLDTIDKHLFYSGFTVVMETVTPEPINSY